ncbi:sugar transferase [Ruegeria sp. HKCCA6707]|uniref:sugar transferase n=1 Tax=Ruegeria sp. HKCCA6707 TaxID=2682996 RepID=UPI0014891471|nr:sugar transferase [Ruegeria sp. HKCCA6707]
MTISEELEIRSEPNLFNPTIPIGGISKRTFDTVMALFALASTAIIFLIVASVIPLLTRSSPIYRHERIGFSGRRFSCLKFRTMHIDADEKLAKHLAEDASAAAEFAKYRKLSKDPRIIPVVGNFLRKTSLDELPQLFNVLSGDMSIVGPRPITEPEFEMYGKGQHFYVQARPGITGLWQVSGRNERTFKERVEIDCQYVGNWSFKRDLAIFFKTPFVVLTGRGAM